MTDTFFHTQKSTQIHTLFLVSICVLFVLFFTTLAPHTAHADVIESFTSNIVVREDSSFTVVEKFQYIFKGVTTPISRCISRVYEEPSSSFFKERYLDIEDIKVQMDNSDIPYTIIETRDEICIAIDSNTTNEKSSRSFELSYTVLGAVVYQKYGGAELHFNVLGYSWNVPMQVVMVNVTSFDTVNAHERACLRGYTGQADSCGTVKANEGVTTFQSRMIKPHEGMIVTYGLNRTKLTEDIRERYTTTAQYLIGGSIVFVLSLLTSYYWYFHRRPRFVDFDAGDEENETLDNK
jgi:Predicted membrane protein (DUF2207)